VTKVTVAVTDRQTDRQPHYKFSLRLGPKRARERLTRPHYLRYSRAGGIFLVRAMGGKSGVEKREMTQAEAGMPSPAILSD